MISTTAAQTPRVRSSKLRIESASQAACTVRASVHNAVARPLRLAASSLGAAAVILSAAAAPALAADLVLGQEVFSNSCAVCHAGGLNNIAGEEKHTLKEDALRKYNLFSVEAIISQVNNGKDAMLPFKDVLTDEEIAAVAEYVFDQAKGNKW